MSTVESMKHDKSDAETENVSDFDVASYVKKIVSFLARNFFTMKFVALAIVFVINFMLLFFKVKGRTR